MLSVAVIGQRLSEWRRACGSDSSGQPANARGFARVCTRMILAAACMGLNAQAAPAWPAVAITDVSIVDVEHGRVTEPRTVLIADGRIRAIVLPAHAEIPPGASRIDGHGRFLIPGLVDMHVHLFNNYSRRAANTWSFPLYVANGVTGVREMAAEPASMLIVDAWRKAIADGATIAPRILAAGVVVYGRSPDDVAAQVDVAADVHADFIKVFSEVPEPNWRATLDAAQHHSLPVMGHVPAGVALLASAQAGQRTSEHLMQAFEACTAIEQTLLESRRGLAGAALVARRDEQEPRVLAAFDQSICDDVAAKLAHSAQAQVPTLVLPHAESGPIDRTPEKDPRWRYLRADERTRWSKSLNEVAPQDIALAADRWRVARKIVATFQRAGVTLLAGTDSPMPHVYPGFALHEELALLVESGLAPSDALRAATLAPAVFLGIGDQAGTVSVGKRADLVLLDANPLRDIRNTQRIRAVLLDGRLFTREALDTLLADAAKTADGR